MHTAFVIRLQNKDFATNKDVLVDVLNTLGRTNRTLMNDMPVHCEFCQQVVIMMGPPIGVSRNGLTSSVAREGNHSLGSPRVQR